MKKHIIILTIALLVLPIFTQFAFGQVPPPGPPAAPPGVPIDGGISLLLAGLGSYAYKNLEILNKKFRSLFLRFNWGKTYLTIFVLKSLLFIQ